MLEFIVDNDAAFSDFDAMIRSGEARLLKLENNIAKVILNKKVIKVELHDKYINRVNNVERIIYGKDSTQSVVNISIKDGTIYVFKNDGSYHTEEYKHWVLSPKQHSGFIPLKGNQYYKYIKEYPLRDFQEIKDKLYKLNCYTLANYPEAFMIKNGYTYFKGMKTTDVSLLSWDIETTGLDPKAKDAKVLLITNTLRKNGTTIKKTFCVEDYETQQDMIHDWSLWVREIDPSVFMGHNIIIFDIPYIKTQMDKVGLPLILGRMDSTIFIAEKTRELRVDGTQTYTYHPVTIFGREVVDTFFLAIKADIGKKYESYGLKKIIQQEGLEKEGRQHYDAANIKKNWNNPEEREKIIKYAEDDSEDPIKLFDLMIAPFFYLTPHIPKTFQNMIESATGSQINSLMVRSYLQDGFSVAKSDDIEPYEGAISFGNTGIYDNVFKIDVSSLYPSIMRQYKIFPEGKDYNGNFLKALEYFTIERLKNKQLAKDTGNRYYKDLEQSQKVVINSAYGFMGAKGLNYNYGKGASEVTRYGREIITKAVEWATGHTLVKTVKHIVNEGKENQEIEYEWVLGDKVCEGKNFVVSNCDTDSISFTASKELTEEDRKQLLDEVNALYPSLITFADDGYFKRVIILKAKNYILWDGKKVKLKGSSLKDQKKEPALKELMNKLIDCLINDTSNLVDIYHSYIKECLNVTDIARWATKKSISKAVLKCATDPNARLNERKVYDAIKDIKIQEGDKVYLYPAILSEQKQYKEYKNGNIKETVIKEVGLKRIDQWTGDHDVEKLIDRVYSTISILFNIVDKNQFVDYTLIKNKNLLDNLK